MFCNHCGQENPDAADFCNRCGQRLTQASQPTSTAVATSVSPLEAAPRKTDGAAIASLVLGVFSLTIFSILAGIPAVILGHMSRSKIKKSMGQLAGEGMALAGLIMGYISFLAIPVILIVAAIAIPNLLRSRIAANEASAVGGIRQITTAVHAYSLEGRDKQLPRGIKDLGLDPSFENVRSGYVYKYTVLPLENGTAEGYFVEATPVKPGSTGRRSFCSDQSGIIRYSQMYEPCTQESAPLE